MQNKAGRKGGFTLIELVVVVGIVAALILVAMPAVLNVNASQRIKADARSVADLLMLARGEAIRTGTQHVVYLGADPAAVQPTDGSGDAVRMAVISDDDGDCRIDGGEAIEWIAAEDGVVTGVTNASSDAPNDTGAGNRSTGSTFTDTGATARDWLLFRPDGIPVVFTGATDCGAQTATGSGGGAIYLTNGDRDYAVTLSPIGGIRVHAWQQGANQWTN
jgi:prepilin-type N-terminal cleavage/methylation domain-containing protein